MCAAAPVLLTMALTLELAGVAWTIKDITQARQRLLKYVHRARCAFPQGLGGRVTAYDPTIATIEPQRGIEERVALLEQQFDKLPEDLDQRDNLLKNHLKGILQGDLAATQQSVQLQLDQVSHYLEEGLQETRISLRGPVAVAACSLASSPTSSL